MDLCLRGSQINLVARQKTKPKYSSQSNLQRSVARPRSASFFQKRSRSSPFLLRPQSADPRFGRNLSSACGSYCSEQDFLALKYHQNRKRFQSVSSSNLLKLLLDEPIKRSWLCRTEASIGGGSSPDNQSDLSTSRKSSSYSSLNRRIRTESGGGSSAEGDNSDKYLRSLVGINAQRKPASSSLGSRMSSTATSTIVKDKSSSCTTTAKNNAIINYWHVTSSSMTTSHLLKKAAKPDLPGRVSFCKPNMQNELDSSDCDNDKQEQYNQFANTATKDEGISAPGPLSMSSYDFTSRTADPVNAASTDTSASGLKKSVHFNPAGGHDVLAETFEYPKCPSENCSCSTRSSSTASIHDPLDAKCACDSPTCKYSPEAGARASATHLDSKKSEQDAGLVHKYTVSEPMEESPVIREYKNAVAEQLENSIVKNILDDGKPKRGDYSGGSNVALPTLLDKYSPDAKAASAAEKQNNFSETKGFSLYKSESRRNLFGGSTNSLSKMDNQFNQTAPVTETPYAATTTESVINNYLKVTTSPPFVAKKKENNKPGSADALLSLKKSKSPTSGKSAAKAKLVNSNLDHSKLKKAMSFGNLREDSNLNEFNLDKVDSWMSMHDPPQKVERKPASTQQSCTDDDYRKLTKETLEIMLNRNEEEERDDSNSQLSNKSDEISQEDSTYDEIVSVIKEIDDDKKKDNYAARPTAEMDLKLETQSVVNEASQSASELNEPRNSPDKYRDILSYLDNVEDSCDKTLLETRRSIPDSNRSEIEFVVEPDIIEDVPKLSDLLMLPNHQLARRVVTLSLRANELANAVHLSKEHVMKIRVERQKSVRAEKANSANRIRDQKKHYEAIVKRHQGFIEQLLKDKGSLCEKVAALTRRLESQNQAWDHKLEAEVLRVKETTLAGEKIRRERWVRENTKRIKELTVKGLEAEINKMNNRHQHEITELKREHQQQLLDTSEEARLKHEQIENSIRETLAKDREAIIEKERAAIRERFERQLDEERKSCDDQKQKISDAFALDRERLQAELKAKELEFQMKRQEIQRDKDGELDEAIAEMQEKMSKQEEKYQNRINTIEKQYQADFEIWKRDYENNCKMAQAEKENMIREHYRAERDRQIDEIVMRIDAEAQKNSEELDVKVNRLKEKYERDMQEIENAERAMREKFTETRSKLAESDAQVRNSQAELKQLRMELQHSQKMCNEFLSERDQYRDNLRNEVQHEVATLKCERDSEIQKIHKRVQQAIEKKDSTIDYLQKENGDMRERCLKLEAVIRQQRKDYCVK